jgi:uncharacterized protein YndB with AHSA1/START domain
MEKSNTIGQTKDTGFQIGVRKTFAVSVETAWDFLFSEKGLAFWLGKFELENFSLDKPYKTKDGIEGKISTFNPFSNIRMTWKPTHWTNISTLQIRVINSKGKATVSFHQDRLLGNDQRNEMKKHWDNVITKLETELTNERTSTR